MRISISLLALIACAVSAAEDNPIILILGDSLSAGYGISTRDTWVRHLEDRLAGAGYPHRVVNASISGETTRGGRTRLPALLERNRPSLVVIELGGNDGLRGISLTEMRENLRAMVEAVHDAGATAVIIEMEIPPNYGRAYIERFRSVFGDVAAATGATAAPFLLENVALNPELMQADGIHPRAAAAPVMLDTVWPTLSSLLDADGPRS